MKNCIYIVGLVLLFSTAFAFGQESMTPARFRGIVNAPGDAVPLLPQLAAAPFWTNSVVSNTMSYATGRVFREVMTQTARTVGGKYVVFTVQSQLYNQPMNAIMGFDEKVAALKIYGLFSGKNGGDVVTEGTAVYDYAKKTYIITSSYGDGFKETTTGSYTDKEDFAKTVVYKNGSLFMTRETTTWPANINKPAN
jgi:hypothetical protein